MDTWVMGPKKNSLPYNELASLILEKRSNPGCPTLVLAESPKQAAKVATELQKQEGLRNMKVIVFDAKVTNANTEVINKAMAMSADAPLVIVTTPSLAVGVNFYKLCFVLMLRQPETLAEFHQVVGRSNRIDPSGPVHVAFPVAQGESIDPKQMHDFLKRKFLRGK